MQIHRTDQKVLPSTFLNLSRWKNAKSQIVRVSYLRFHGAFLEHVLINHLSGWDGNRDGFCIMKSYWLQRNLQLYISKSQNSTSFWVSMSSMWHSARYSWILERKELGWPTRSSRFLTKLSRKINLGQNLQILANWHVWD